MIFFCCLLAGEVPAERGGKSADLPRQHGGNDGRRRL